MTYPAVSVEKRPRRGLYRVSTGADSGYGETLEDFGVLENAIDHARDVGEEVYYSETVEEELQEA